MSVSAPVFAADVIDTACWIGFIPGAVFVDDEDKHHTGVNSPRLESRLVQLWLWTVIESLMPCLSLLYKRRR
jgi:hypothetical protein